MNTVKFFTKLFSKYMLLMSALFVGAIIAYGLIFSAYISKYQSNDPERIYQSILEASSDSQFGFDKSSKTSMDRQKVWAMVLDQKGNVVSSYHLPKSLNHHYHNTQIAQFSRWYLNDYPVFSYIRGKQILVIGYPKTNSISRYNFYMETDFIRKFFNLGLAFLGLVFIVLFLIFSHSRLRIKREIAPIVKAVDSLSRGEKVTLDEKGNLTEITSALNKTSHLLGENRVMREQWVRGVSHDLRNPLMLISGYSSQLEQQYGNSQQIQAINSQLQNMEEIISNLNLSYLLDDSSQQLNFSKIDIIAVLRSVLADIFNNYETVSVNFELPSQPVIVEGDFTLLERAFRNILLNSIQHSNSSKIDLSCQLVSDKVEIIISDDGSIDPDMITELNHKTTNYASHGMGTIITKQIIKLHYGKTVFVANNPGLKVIFDLPLDNSTKT